MNKNKVIVSRVLAVITMIIWSITFVSTKILLDFFSPTDLLLVRVIIALAFSEIISPKIQPFMGWKTELFCVLTALSGVGLYQLAENYALSFTSASQVSVIVSTAPLLTILVAVILKKIKAPSFNYILGFLLAIGGISIICFQSGFGHTSVKGLSLAFLAALCWAIYSFAFGKVVSLGVEDRTITKRMFFYSILFLIPFSLTDGNAIDYSSFLNWKVIVNMLFLAVVAQATAFLLWNKALKGLGAIEANIYIYLVPSITALFSVLILGEPFTMFSFVGTVLVLVGLCFSDSSIVERIKKKWLAKSGIK